MVAMEVVDRLEAIQIAVQQRQGRAILLIAVLEIAVEARAVQDAGQSISFGQIEQSLFFIALNCDVLHQADHPRHHAIRLPQGHIAEAHVPLRTVRVVSGPATLCEQRSAARCRASPPNNVQPCNAAGTVAMGNHHVADRDRKAVSPKNDFGASENAIVGASSCFQGS